MAGNLGYSATRNMTAALRWHGVQYPALIEATGGFWLFRS
jgi:hypothetical protein